MVNATHTKRRGDYELWVGVIQLYNVQCQWSCDDYGNVDAQTTVTHSGIGFVYCECMAYRCTGYSRVLPPVS